MMKRNLLLSLCALLLCVPVLSSQTTAHPLKIGGDVKAPVPIKSVGPKFPTFGFFHKIEKPGSVSLDIIVDSKGMPQDIHIYKSGGKKFDKNAVAAVRQYRFRPATLHGKPVAVTVRINVAFRICHGTLDACKAEAQKQKGYDKIIPTDGAAQSAPAEGSGVSKD